jgi:hypothetical protein
LGDVWLGRGINGSLTSLDEKTVFAPALSLC